MNKIKQKKLLWTILLFVFTFCGCLDFGEDIETASPTKDQTKACRSLMYIKRTVEITPLGYKLQGSGIDDTIWFKFETSSTNLEDIFDTTVVDLSKFKDDFAHRSKNMPQWWDVANKKLFGDSFIHNHKGFNIGAEKTDTGYVIYIRWNEF